MKYLLTYNDYLNEKRMVAGLNFTNMDSFVDFAIKYHNNQKRKIDGTPYVYHPARVAKIVLDKTKNVELAKVAFLHDIIEDSDINWKDLSNTFGVKVAKIVQSLSHKSRDIKTKNFNDKSEAKAAYLLKKMMKFTDDELTIKLADRLDNIRDLSDPRASVKWSDNYASQTFTIIKNLKTNRDLKPSHLEIIKEIEVILNKYKKIKSDV